MAILEGTEKIDLALLKSIDIDYWAMKNAPGSAKAPE
jgi:hypothetical protein